jgi:hypothetical protein
MPPSAAQRLVVDYPQRSTASIVRLARAYIEVET